MSRSMRAVREVYGAATDTFVPPDAAVYVLRAIAALAGCHVEDDDYGDKTSVCVQQGAQFLDFVESPGLTAGTLRTPESAVEDVEEGQLESLVQNLKTHAADWRTLVDPDGGTLTIYVDN